MSERPRFVRKQVIRSGTPNIRFEEQCQAKNTEIEQRLPKTITAKDLLPGWTKLLQQAGLDVQLELNTSEDLTNQE